MKVKRLCCYNKWQIIFNTNQIIGATVWNVGDTDNWIVVGPPAVVDYPTLFDKDYKKKPAYSGFW